MAQSPAEGRRRAGPAADAGADPGNPVQLARPDDCRARAASTFLPAVGRWASRRCRAVPHRSTSSKNPGALPRRCRKPAMNSGPKARACTPPMHLPTSVASRRSRFTLVFLDPPYADDSVAELCRLLGQGNWLLPGATVYFEQEKTQSPPELPAGWSITAPERGGPGSVFARDNGHFAQGELNDDRIGNVSRHIRPGDPGPRRPGSPRRAPVRQDCGCHRRESRQGADVHAGRACRSCRTVLSTSTTSK